MTIRETGEILDVLTVAYPQFYAKQDEDKRYKAIQLWATQFEDVDTQVVVAAVQAYISNNNPFPPSIGEIKDWIYKLYHPNELTEMEAWHLASKAIRNGYYNGRKEYEKLPPAIQQIIGSPNRLKEWSMLPERELETVIQSNFMRSYKEKAKHFREYELLPESVKSFVGELGESMSMPRLPENDEDVNQKRNRAHALLMRAQEETEV